MRVGRRADVIEDAGNKSNDEEIEVSLTGRNLGHYNFVCYSPPQEGYFFGIRNRETPMKTFMEGFFVMPWCGSLREIGIPPEIPWEWAERNSRRLFEKAFNASRVQQGLRRNVIDSLKELKSNIIKKDD